ALPTVTAAFIISVYGIRRCAYPLFAFSFLVWAQIASPERMRGSVAGWFWFAFTGGLPTLGSAVAGLAIGPLGMSLYGTLILSLVLVTIGVVICVVGVREPHGSKPVADENGSNPTSLTRVVGGGG